MSTLARRQDLKSLFPLSSPPSKVNLSSFGHTPTYTHTNTRFFFFTNRVETMLDDIDMEGGDGLAEFDAQFEEMKLEEEFAGMDLGGEEDGGVLREEEFAEMQLGE